MKVTKRETFSKINQNTMSTLNAQLQQDISLLNSSDTDEEEGELEGIQLSLVVRR